MNYLSEDEKPGLRMIPAVLSPPAEMDITVNETPTEEQAEQPQKSIRLRWHEVLLFPLLGMVGGTLALLPALLFLPLLFKNPNATPAPFFLLPAVYLYVSALTASACIMAWLYSVCLPSRIRTFWALAGTALSALPQLALWGGTLMKNKEHGDLWFVFFLVSAYCVFLFFTTMVFLPVQDNKRNAEREREPKIPLESRRNTWKRRLIHPLLVAAVSIVSCILCGVIAAAAAFLTPIAAQFILFLPVAVAGPVLVMWYLQKRFSWL